MKALAMGLAAAVLVVAAPALAAPAPIVFFDIAGPDLKTQSAFYEAVFDWKAGATGAVSVPVVSPLPGNLRQDPADRGIYIGVDDVTATLAKITAHGGKVIAPRFEVKGVVVLGLFADPAGNHLGLVEMAGGKAKIP